jgi:uncharacterized membrane protein
MRDYEVFFALQAEALHSLEAKAEALRDQIERQEVEGQDPEQRLEKIERILARLYGQ